jgi:hypothetical protein
MNYAESQVMFPKKTSAQSSVSTSKPSKKPARSRQLAKFNFLLGSSKMSGDFQQTIRCYIPEDRTPYNR